MPNSTDKLKSISKVQLNRVRETAIKQLENKAKNTNVLYEQVYVLSPEQLLIEKYRMAIHMIRNSLHLIAIEKAERFEYLINHPVAADVYSAEKGQLSWVYLGSLKPSTLDTHPELKSLAQVLKATLPELVYAFENYQDLSKVWFQAAYELSINPLPLTPVKTHRLALAFVLEDERFQVFSSSQRCKAVSRRKSSRWAQFFARSCSAVKAFNIFGLNVHTTASNKK